MRFAQRSLAALGQLIVLRLPNVIVLMLLSRFQGADAAGLFSLAVTYLILLTAWWVGLDERVIRETARAGSGNAPAPTQNIRRTVYLYGLLRVAVSTLLTAVLIGFLWARHVYPPADWRFIAVFLLSSVADGFSGAVQAGVIGREKFWHAFGMSAIQTGLRIGLVGAALVLELGLLAIAWAWAAGAWGGVVVALIVAHTTLPAGAPHAPAARRRGSWRAWAAEHWAFVVIGILATLEYQQDIIILSAYQPLAIIGYYSVATTLFSAAGLPIQALRMVLFPRMARAAALVEADGDAPQNVFLRDLYAFSVQWLLAVGVLCAFLGYVYSPSLITLLFGAEMLPALGSVRLLMAALVFFALNVPQSRLLLASGRQNRTAVLVTISTVVNLLANLWLVRRYGAPGAALARNISTALYLALAVFTLAGTIRRPTWPALLAPFAALAVAASVVWALAAWPWWLAAALAGGVYLVTLIGIFKLTNTWKPPLVGANATGALPG